MAFKRKCGQCALPGLRGEACPVFNKKMNIEDLACPLFTREIVTCTYCGSPIIPASEAILCASSNGGYRVVCDNCRTLIGTCRTCIAAQTCAFESHPSPNKYIMETVRQGNVLIQKQVQNPEICRETCTESCKCFSPEKGCLRQNNYCGNWEEKE